MEDKKRVKRMKMKRRKMRRRIRLFLFGVSILCGYFAARAKLEVYSVLNTINRAQATDFTSLSVKEEDLVSDNKIINILLVGSDKRAQWKQTGRSDSVMIATLDTKHKKLKVTSLMRDMYVEIPGYYKTKFNAAYSFGGVSLLYDTIARNFDMKLDGYVVVDFAAFEDVINTIGGVKIKLTDEEYEYLTTAYKRGPVLELKRGINNMNGAQALAYSRIRQDGQGDFGRTQRQRKVLQAIFSEVKSMGYNDIIKLAKKTLPNVSTNLSNGDILSYLKSILFLGTTTIDQMRIPIDDSYYQDRINKQAVLVPDLEVNREALHDFIFEKEVLQVSQ